MAELIVSPSVSIVKNRPAVSSLAVAESFGKQHAHVMRDIRKTMDKCPKEFNASNFGLVKNADAKGEFRDSFNLFRDGFMLVVMSYTGDKAMQIKLAYISRFNEMEAELARIKTDPPTLETDSRLSKRTDPERKALTAIINTWVGMAPIHYASARSQVNAHFGVTSVDELTIAQCKEAIQWIQGKIDGIQKALPEPEKESAKHLSAITLEQQLDPHFQAIRASVNQIFEHENEIYRIIKRATLPALGIADNRSNTLVNMHYVMDHLWYTITEAVKASEFHAKTMCVMVRS